MICLTWQLGSVSRSLVSNSRQCMQIGQNAQMFPCLHLSMLRTRPEPRMNAHLQRLVVVWRAGRLLPHELKTPRGCHLSLLQRWIWKFWNWEFYDRRVSITQWRVSVRFQLNIQEDVYGRELDKSPYLSFIGSRVLCLRSEASNRPRTSQISGLGDVTWRQWNIRLERGSHLRFKPKIYVLQCFV